MSSQQTAIDINRLQNSMKAHEIEVKVFENAIKNAINTAISGIEIESVHLAENTLNEFQFSIWGKFSTSELMSD